MKCSNWISKLKLLALFLIFINQVQSKVQRKPNQETKLGPSIGQDQKPQKEMLYLNDLDYLKTPSKLNYNNNTEGRTDELKARLFAYKWSKINHKKTRLDTVSPINESLGKDWKGYFVSMKDQTGKEFKMKVCFPNDPNTNNGIVVNSNNNCMNKIKGYNTDSPNQSKEPPHNDFNQENVNTDNMSGSETPHDDFNKVKVNTDNMSAGEPRHNDFNKKNVNTGNMSGGTNEDMTENSHDEENSRTPQHLEAPQPDTSENEMAKQNNIKKKTKNSLPPSSVRSTPKLKVEPVSVNNNKYVNFDEGLAPNNIASNQNSYLKNNKQIAETDNLNLPPSSQEPNNLEPHSAGKQNMNIDDSEMEYMNSEDGVNNDQKTNNQQNVISPPQSSLNNRDMHNYGQSNPNFHSDNIIDGKASSNHEMVQNHDFPNNTNVKSHMKLHSGHKLGNFANNSQKLKNQNNFQVPTPRNQNVNPDSNKSYSKDSIQRLEEAHLNNDYDPKKYRNNIKDQESLPSNQSPNFNPNEIGHNNDNATNNPENNHDQDNANFNQYADKEILLEKKAGLRKERKSTDIPPIYKTDNFL